MTLDEVYAGVDLDPFWDHLRLPGINFVPGYGTREPKVLIVGEAPGASENGRRRPFCGPSGRVLEQLMDLARLWAYDSSCDPSRPANAFLTNVVKYRPPGNRTPNVAEVARGVKSLRQEWAALGEPKAIIAVGGTAHLALSPSVTSVSRNVGTWHNVNDTWIVSMLHPAYALHKRDPEIQRTMERDWEQIGYFLASEGIT